MLLIYRIRSIRRRGYYLFQHAILCGVYSRAAFINICERKHLSNNSTKTWTAPFADVEEDEVELEENKLVPEDC